MLDLANKTVAEKSDLKASAIVTLTPKGKFTSGDIQVEIIAVSKIKEGVEVFAKAWKGKDQIGFGADGSVDIERFRFFNPPVMVPDGTQYEAVETTRRGIFKYKVDNFKYDPAGALRSIILDAVKTVGKINSKVQNGKIGNTTAVFYPAAGANSPMDGRILASGFVSWNDGRNTTSANAYLDNTSSTFVIGSYDSGYYDLQRCVFCFDTSTLGSAVVVNSATISIKSTGSGDAVETTYPADPRFVTFTPSSTSTMDGNDFVLSKWGSTSLVETEVSLATFVGTSGYVDWTLNTTGLSNINKTGVSVFGCRPSSDIANTPPSNFSGGRCYYADSTGTTNDPKLTVTYSAPSFPQLIMVTQ